MGPSFQRWERQPAPEVLEGPLRFMQVEIDYYSETPDPRFIAGKKPETTVPVLRLFGVTEAGNSVLAHIHGFDPYFYVQCPSQEVAAQPEIFKQALEDQLAPTERRG